MVCRQVDIVAVEDTVDAVDMDPSLGLMVVVGTGLQDEEDTVLHRVEEADMARRGEVMDQGQEPEEGGHRRLGINHSEVPMIGEAHLPAWVKVKVLIPDRARTAENSLRDPATI